MERGESDPLEVEVLRTAGFLSEARDYNNHNSQRFGVAKVLDV